MINKRQFDAKCILLFISRADFHQPEKCSTKFAIQPEGMFILCHSSAIEKMTPAKKKGKKKKKIISIFLSIEGIQLFSFPKETISVIFSLNDW